MISIVFLILLIMDKSMAEFSNYPWTYDDDLFGGPEFWGLVNREWRMCNKGKMQSPIDINPNELLFDPHLGSISIDKTTVQSELINTGQMPRVLIQDTIDRPTVNISGGPLGPYRYRVHRIDLHFGRESELGSEHTIDSLKFPMELQILAYNHDLYANFTVAAAAAHGIAAIAVMVQMGGATNGELQKLTTSTSSITFKGAKSAISDLKPHRLLPSTEFYVTYQGSLTVPGCYESVIWIIPNNPIYITAEDYDLWKSLQQTDKKLSDPQYIAPNARPLQQLNNRIIRTNISHRFKTTKEHICQLHLNETAYRSNPLHDQIATKLSHQRHHRRVHRRQRNHHRR